VNFEMTSAVNQQRGFALGARRALATPQDDGQGCRELSFRPLRKRLHMASDINQGWSLLFYKLWPRQLAVTGDDLENGVGRLRLAECRIVSFGLFEHTSDG
jgi:hypothetical protein